MANHQKSHRNKNKRKRSPDKDPFQLAYQNTTYTNIPSSCRPGSPDRYFKESFHFSFEKSVQSGDDENHSEAKTDDNQSFDVQKKTKVDESSKEKTDTGTPSKKQVIHHHVNGLCIITVGDLLSDTSAENGIERIEFIAKMASDSMSAGEKRKQQSKMMRGKAAALEKEGVVTPSTVLANIHFQSDQEKSIEKIYAGVWGHLVELNERLTPDLLKSDPLLNGYVAIVLPTGPFPPPPTDKKSTEKTSEPDKPSEMSLIPVSVLEQI